MTPIKTARMMRNLSQKELADKLGISTQMLNGYESGNRTPGPSLCPRIADALGVSEAYLKGTAQNLPLHDFESGRIRHCPIMAETIIDGYGSFYLVYLEEIDAPVAVILSEGIQFTTSDWQGWQPMDVDDIKDPCCGWVDARGVSAIMLDGLPRTMF